MTILRPRAGSIRSGKLKVNLTLGIATLVAAVITTGICSAASPVRIACALPYTQGQSDQACVGQNRVVITTANTDANAKVTAELVGLDVNGNLINSFVVNNGDQVQMGSKLSPTDWKFVRNTNLTEVFAPVPLLHVTVEDQGQTAEAFCSNIPYVEMIEPKGTVVTTDSGGGDTNVLAAVPLTNPKSLHLYVDGVDLLAQVPAPGYLQCTPNSPCSGTATINGNMVSYSNLIVDVASSISSPASNTVQATVSDLTCGGHIFKVSTAKSSTYPSKVSGACDVDPLSKTATSSVFGITISDPTPLEVTMTVPTPVAGQVCSGTQITDVNINGKDLPLTGETFTAGNGITTGPKYVVPINTTLDQTDLLRDVFGTHDAPLGTFDAGSNRLAASAKDALGNRAYKNFIFAAGAVTPVAIAANAVVFQTESIKAEVNSQLKDLVDHKVKAEMVPTSVQLQNAFVVGLTASGVQTEYQKLCNSPITSTTDSTINGLTPGQIFQKKVTAGIEGVTLPVVNFGTTCTCSVNVPIVLKSVTVGTDVSCNLTFNNGSFHVTMGLPDVTVVVDEEGWCEDDFLGACVDRLVVALEQSATISGIHLDFDVTESDLLNNTTEPPTPPTVPTPVTTVTKLTDPFGFGDTGVSQDCLGASICNFGLGALDVLSFGLLDLDSFNINLENLPDFSNQIVSPGAVKLDQIKVDPSVVANFNQKESGGLSEVHITTAGITAGLTATVATTAVDPSVPPTPGAVLTPAPVPTLPITGMSDVLLAVSNDFIDMAFANLTAAGKLSIPTASSCIDTGKTVGDVLPMAGCDSLSGSTDDATVAARAFCHAIEGDSCSGLSFVDPMASSDQNATYTATEQGICYGAQGLPAGQTCGSLSNGNLKPLVFFGACSVTPDFNLNKSEPLLFCAKGDVPPRMLFPDSPAGTPNSVPAALRIPSMSVSLIVDRNLNHEVDSAFQTVPGCFVKGNPTSGDCNIFQSCLDLNMDFTMSLQTCSDNKPGFVPTFVDVQAVTRQVGTVCGGSASPTTDSNVLTTSSNDNITMPIAQNGASFAPPICGLGLDLGGLVSCSNPGILSIRSENTFLDSRDYLGITCKIN